jgi:hypothetical protein
MTQQASVIAPRHEIRVQRLTYCNEVDNSILLTIEKINDLLILCNNLLSHKTNRISSTTPIIRKRNHRLSCKLHRMADVDDGPEVHVLVGT